MTKENEKDARAPDVEENSIKEILATNITRYRQKLGLSRAALAEKIGVTEQSIGQYERGTRTPQIDIICKIADVVNAPIDEILERRASGYNAVREYRFDRAVTLLQRFELFVLEDDDGRIIIRERVEEIPKFHQSDNGIVVSGVQEKFRTLAIFVDRKSFVLWIEHYIKDTLYDGAIKRMIQAGLYYLSADKPFEPLVKIKYEGNLEDEM